MYIVHNMDGTPTYRAWITMKTRCLNKKHPSYKNYGEKGIKICKRWLKSFKNFFADMGIKPQGYTLDRKNPYGDYEPSNCKWSTPKEQANNRTDNVYLSHNGITKTIGAWEVFLRINKDVLRSRIKMGWETERALFAPVRKINKYTRTKKKVEI